MNILAAQAREENVAALRDTKSAAQHRARRDELIRRLRADDPEVWTYAALAKAVGIGPELIAKIIQGRT